MVCAIICISTVELLYYSMCTLALANALAALCKESRVCISWPRSITDYCQSTSSVVTAHF